MAEETVPRRSIRPRLPIVTVLTLGIGGLVFLAVASVLYLGLDSARDNTMKLLEDKAQLLLTASLHRLRSYLNPAKQQLDYLQNLAAQGRLDLDDKELLERTFTGALSATPQINSLIYIDQTYQLFGVHQGKALPERLPTSVVPRAHNFKAVEAFRGLTEAKWGELIYVAETGTTYVNLQQPVYQKDMYRGLLVAAVPIGALSDNLAELGFEVGSTPYLLYGRDHLLAHPLLADGYPDLSPDNPLPTLDHFTDPVMAAVWDEAGLQDAANLSNDVERRRVRRAGGHYLFLHRTVREFGDTPWIIGSYFPVADVSQEVRRLVFAAIAGILMLFAAVLAVGIIARHIAQPVARLALGARQIRSLEFGTVEPIPRSRLRELDDAAQAFNAMLKGLRWFEAYVPRQLVQRLMRTESGGSPGSESRDITVMFTDIVGFTTVAEELGAEQVANLLNRHFQMVTDCIEAEGGIVDKFIGDGVMAFWGAPELSTDHAAQACRAAQGIAQAMQGSGLRLRLRIGIHSGSAVVGNIGAADRLNYTIVGDTVNSCSRIEQLGKSIAPDAEMCILASEAVVSAAGDGFGGTPVGRLPIRGRAAPLAVYRLAETVAGSDQTQAPSAGKIASQPSPVGH